MYSFESYWISISKFYDLLINAKISVFRSSVNSCILLSYCIYILVCNTCVSYVCLNFFSLFHCKEKNATFGFVLYLPLLLLHIAVCSVQFPCIGLRMCRSYLCVYVPYCRKEFVSCLVWNIIYNVEFQFNSIQSEHTVLFLHVVGFNQMSCVLFELKPQWQQQQQQ